MYEEFGETFSTLVLVGFPLQLLRKDRLAQIEAHWCRLELLQAQIKAYQCKSIASSSLYAQDWPLDLSLSLCV